MKTIRCFTPGKNFPAVSVTGTKCELLCPHCMGHPLSGMIDASTPEKLLEIASNLEKTNALGFLLSGGCNSNGILPIKSHLPAVKTIKGRNRLKINAHVGYPREKDAPNLVESGIDVFSITFPINDEVGLGVLRVPNAIDRYFETIDSLTNAGAKKVLPHILIGLTNMDDEIEGLRLVGNRPPKSIVIISFLPFPGTPMHNAPPADENHILEFVGKCRNMFPETQIVMGCMRKHGLPSLEKSLMENFVDGIVMPSRESMKYISGKQKIETFEGCCALYL